MDQQDQVRVSELESNWLRGMGGWGRLQTPPCWDQECVVLLEGVAERTGRTERDWEDWEDWRGVFVKLLPAWPRLHLGRRSWKHYIT